MKTQNFVLQNPRPTTLELRNEVSHFWLTKARMTRPVLSVKNISILIYFWIFFFCFIDYFDQVNCIPIPFSILHIAWQLVSMFVSIFNKIFGNQNKGIPDAITLKCEFKIEHWKARQKHAKLMLKLIHRYFGRSQAENNELNKVGIEKFKKKVFERLDSAFKLQLGGTNEK